MENKRVFSSLKSPHVLERVLWSIWLYHVALTCCVYWSIKQKLIIREKKCFRKGNETKFRSIPWISLPKTHICSEGFSRSLKKIAIIPLLEFWGFAPVRCIKAEFPSKTSPDRALLKIKENVEGVGHQPPQDWVEAPSFWALILKNELLIIFLYLFRKTLSKSLIRGLATKCSPFLKFLWWQKKVSHKNCSDHWASLAVKECFNAWTVHLLATCRFMASNGCRFLLDESLKKNNFESETHRIGAKKSDTVDGSEILHHL